MTIPTPDPSLELHTTTDLDLRQLRGHTTAQKLHALRDALMTTDPREMPDEVREFVTGLQMASGMGFDILGILTPSDPDDCALMVDRAIVMLLQLRGDDLPPFNAEMYSELGDRDDASAPATRDGSSS